MGSYRIEFKRSAERDIRKIGAAFIPRILDRIEALRDDPRPRRGGGGRSGGAPPATGLSTRLLDFLRALDELVDYAVAERVDLVLFCGDAYKSREPSQTHQRELARRGRRLVDAGIPVFLLVGNHDLPAAVSRATSLEIFGTLLGERQNHPPEADRTETLG